MECGSFDLLTNSVYVGDSTSTTYGSHIELTCMDGYIYQDNKWTVMFTCNKQGDWEPDADWPLPDAPKCSGKLLIKGIITHEFEEFDIFSHFEVVRFTCTVMAFN